MEQDVPTKSVMAFLGGIVVVLGQYVKTPEERQILANEVSQTIREYQENHPELTHDEKADLLWMKREFSESLTSVEIEIFDPPKGPGH